MILVESIAHLQTLSTDTDVGGNLTDFFVMLSAFGRSSKRILYVPKFDEFVIVNEIDDSCQELKTDELASKTILVEAIEKKALYMY